MVLEKILGWKIGSKKIGEKSPIFPIKTNFFPDSKNMKKKIAFDGFRTHPKCLKVAPSNHQTIDCPYYIYANFFIFSYYLFVHNPFIIFYFIFILHYNL